MSMNFQQKIFRMTALTYCRLLISNMNFYIHLLPILFIIFTCADTPNTPVIQKELFGWAGASEDINKKPHEYFYAKFYGKVEILSTKLKAEDYQNKCIQSAMKQAKEEILFIAIVNVFYGMTDTDGWDIDLHRAAKKNKNSFPINLLLANPIAYRHEFYNGSEWRDCECIFYMKVPGGRDAIVVKMMEI